MAALGQHCAATSGTRAEHTIRALLARRELGREPGGAACGSALRKLDGSGILTRGLAGSLTWLRLRTPKGGP
jgi:hypothetical protein